MKGDTFEVVWDNILVRKLAELFGEVRLTWPKIGDCSTPELLVLEMNKERWRTAEFLQRVRAILDCHRPPCLDLRIVASIEALREAHDAAKERCGQ